MEPSSLNPQVDRFPLRLKWRLRLLTALIFLLPFSAVSAGTISVSSGTTCTVPYLREPTILKTDFNNDGIADQYRIFDDLGKLYSKVSLSKDGVQYGETYQIEESWALAPEMHRYAPDLPTALAAGDANNDGFDDVAAAFGSSIVVRTNANAGTFTEGGQFLDLTDLYGTDESPIPLAKVNYGSKTAFLDANKDGYPDLFVVHAEGISVFLNDTTGHFAFTKKLDLPGITDHKVASVYVSDLDADSSPELVISGQGSYVIYFGANLHMDVVPIANNSDRLKSTYQNGDDKVDFVEASNDPCYSPSVYHYWINQGNGIFTEEVGSAPAVHQLITDTTSFIPSAPAIVSPPTNSGGVASQVVLDTSSGNAFSATTESTGPADIHLAAETQSTAGGSNSPDNAPSTSGAGSADFLLLCGLFGSLFMTRRKTIGVG